MPARRDGWIDTLRTRAGPSRRPERTCSGGVGEHSRRRAVDVLAGSGPALLRPRSNRGLVDRLGGMFGARHRRNLAGLDEDTGFA